MGNYCQYIVEMVCKTSCHTSHWLLPSEFLRMGPMGTFCIFQGSNCKIWLELMLQTMTPTLMVFGSPSKILLRSLNHLSELIYQLYSQCSKGFCTVSLIHVAVYKGCCVFPIVRHRSHSLTDKSANKPDLESL